MTAALKPSHQNRRKIALSVCDTHSHGTLSYLDMGRADGPCVVFLHGFGADLLTWQLCLVPLASRYRIVALDLPGHGRSTPDVGDASMAFMTGWLDEAFDALGIGEAHLVGHSMGAKIALGFALAHPHRVASLGLVSPAGLGGDFHIDTLDGFLNATDPVEAVAKQLVGPKGVNLVPALAKSLSEAARGGSRNAALQKLLHQSKAYGLTLSPEGFDWSRIRVPVTVLWGDHDRLIPMPSVHLLPPHGDVHVLEGVGHLPHMEASNAVVQVLKDFLP